MLQRESLPDRNGKFDILSSDIHWCKENFSYIRSLINLDIFSLRNLQLDGDPNSSGGTMILQAAQINDTTCHFKQYKSWRFNRNDCCIKIFFMNYLPQPWSFHLHRRFDPRSEGRYAYLIILHVGNELHFV